MKIRKRLRNINFDKRKISLNPRITQQTLVNIVAVILGSFLFSIGVNSFMIAGNLGEGGVTGLAIILLYAFDISPAISTLILNGALLAIGFRFLSRRSMYYTIFAVIMMSFFLGLTETWAVETDEILINTVFGGLLIGTGHGLVVRIGATTAGSAILGRLANKYLDVNISYAMFFVDITVIILSLTVLPLERVLLTVIAIYIAVRVMDFIVEGMNPKKAVTIIADNPKSLGTLINSEIGRGVTMLDGKGFYSKEEKDILYAIINKSQLIRLKRLIRKYDENAFVVVHDVNSVLGGYFI